jgi:endonuclease YncB( thermonuclease family)
VIDGDTIEIHGQRIRLHGVDTAETDQVCQDAGGRDYRCGVIATRALARLIGSAVVTCRKTDADRHGRTVAVCHTGGTDLSGWLVTEGLGLAFRRYSFEHVAEEDRARAHGRGLWAGRFTPPWEWRQPR